MFYPSRLLLLVAILWGAVSTHAAEQELAKEDPIKVGKAIGKILKKPTTLINLSLVAGYWRRFTTSDFLLGIGSIIYSYAHGPNYPYTAVKFVGSQLVNPQEFKNYNDRTYLYLNMNTSASIEEEVIHLTHYSNDTGLKRASIPNRAFIRDGNDRPARLIPLKSALPGFAFLVLSQAGYMTYVVSKSENFVPDQIIYVDNFFALDNVLDQVSFYTAEQPSSFFLLIDTPDPILAFYQLGRNQNNPKAIWVIKFDTSSWHKNSKNSFRNMRFLDDKHFVILNHLPHVGSNLFLYSIENGKPIGYISFDKKYTCLRKFSFDSLCLFSQTESSMMIFDHTNQSFMNVEGNEALRPLTLLPNTEQMIMIYVNSEIMDKNADKEGKLFLCNVKKEGITIQARFNLQKWADNLSNVDMSCLAKPDHSLIFLIKPIDNPGDLISYSQQTFNLVHDNNIGKTLSPF